MKIINNIKTFLLKRKLLVGIILVVIIIILLISGHKQPTQNITVTRGTVTETALLSGKVVTEDRADLGFAASGRVQHIYVKNNQHVTKGQILAQLEIGDLLADRAVQVAQSHSATANEDTKVTNAYRTLLSSDLALTPDSATYSMATPVISGAYSGQAGTYKIIFSKKYITDTDVIMDTLNAERTTVKINKETATALGTRGLFISLPDDPARYVDTIWYLDIPNTKGASYGVNYNAWQQATTARDRALADSGASQLQKIDAEISKNSIYAPFTGTVTNINKQIGESATTGEQVISMVGDGNLEVVLQVPELDVSKIMEGTKIAVTLDAIPGETFDGVVSTINSRDTEVDGVPVYEAFVELPADARVKSGMTAYGSVLVAQKTDVVTVPLYALTKEGDTYSANVVVGKKTETRTVTVGLIGSDSTAEILSGLAEDDIITTAATK